MSALLSIPVNRIDGTVTSLADFRGQVLLVVNVASRCGLTPQYASLEKLYETYKDQNFAVLGFPANDFGAQEPGTNFEIMQFCETKFGVKFPMFEKIIVTGAAIHPLYAELVKTPPARDIQWNFEKFLIARDGTVAGRFEPTVQPNDPKLIAALEAELAK